MKREKSVTILLLIAIEVMIATGKSTSFDYPLKPVPFNEVEMTGEFWRSRLITQQKTLVPLAFERTQPGVEHLQAAGDFLSGKNVQGHRPHRYIDSDLYKVMEGAAYLLQFNRDPEIEARFDQFADIITAAQQENGYLYPSHCPMPKRSTKPVPQLATCC